MGLKSWVSYKLSNQQKWHPLSRWMFAPVYKRLRKKMRSQSLAIAYLILFSGAFHFLLNYIFNRLIFDNPQALILLNYFCALYIALAIGSLIRHFVIKNPDANCISRFLFRKIQGAGGKPSVTYRSF